VSFVGQRRASSCKHDRDIVTDRVGQLARLADQFRSALRYSRLALQIGQTRISSSLASIEFLQNSLDQDWVCQLPAVSINGARPAAPMPRHQSGGAFYRIFFGHQDSTPARRHKVGRLKLVMVGKGVRSKGQPERFEMAEKAGGIADPGIGVQGLSGQVAGTAMPTGIAQRKKALTCKTHHMTGHASRNFWQRCGTVQHDGIHLAQTAERLAQGTRWQQMAVARATPVEDRQLDIACRR
jgi:hypothetical protein